ncbi:TIGR03087 family PEP-CTERM/XrtA system glycosyltransferase [Allorhodopirellula solitaria]|uniref:GDP-mannose-dependent alpha-(1-6)-phosphatidylinositol monomannoside mannosyltransferase n=1 Tax=Allorhodopirellula solitaria TaxID=2527987 RepID=A0A5C5WZX6_9BACT|nr:TIGR03087 family PEP-CTERM/XrtA system glycosyltransferase [Allorhodopirellula solitaria]TWT55869.1 GDP-mannose-dependent alpha-(1-6)-phosphatidylinositol monomannoside mannosyltransferase [Allorhodopirellula solitaria]
MDPSTRLLMLTHRFPFPPTSGDRIRSYNLLRFLASQYRVSLACTADEPVSDQQLSHVREMCEQVHVCPVGGVSRKARAATAFARGKSLTEGMFHTPDLHKRVRDWHQRDPFDFVVVFCSSMYPYVDHPDFRVTPTIVDLVDVDSEKWTQMSVESVVGKRLVYAVEAKRVRALERRIAEQASSIVLVSDSEAELFRQVVAPAASVHGISNGVDTEYFCPGDQSTPAKEAGSTSVALRLVFTGVLSYPPNVEGISWFCEHVFPGIREQFPVELEIVGRSPNARVQSLAAIDGVTVVGEVPDVRPHLHHADVAISPLKLARGIQNKVLEAMACELPVVVTTRSAEGIDAISGQHLLVADNVAQWQAAIAELARQPNRRAVIGKSARQLVVSDYSWPARLSKFLDLIPDPPAAKSLSSPS